VHKDPDKLPEEGLSRPLFKKKKQYLIPFTLILLTLITAVTILFFWVGPSHLNQQEIFSQNASEHVAIGKP